MKENKTEETDENKESIVALNDSLDLQVYSNELKEQSEDETGEQISKWDELRLPKSTIKRLRNKFYIRNLYNWRSKTELDLNEDIKFKQVLDEAFNDDGVVRKKMENVRVFPPPFQGYLYDAAPWWQNTLRAVLVTCSIV